MKIIIYWLAVSFLALAACTHQPAVHIWETVELTFHAKDRYDNPYTDVELWVALTGPGFEKKVHGFWDGENIYRVRIMATSPGTWNWISHSNVEDGGLANKAGSFTATEWSEEEVSENPNRRGTIRPTENGRALEYADGTPFFLLSDTHWAAATWRYPFKEEDPDPDYLPGPGIGFEEFIQHMKKNGFNSIGFITCFPNWATDDYPASLADDAGVSIRKPWPKPGQEGKCIDMHDEDGERPFFFPGKCSGRQDACADFDRINPEYWQNLDKKMDYMRENGMVPYLESVRRDHLHTWMAYHDFNESFARFLLYLRARYGSHNMIYTLLHGDYFGGMETEPIHDALDHYYQKYGPMPFGQPTTLMSHKSTNFFFGHGEESPWLQMHTSGNATRNHQIYKWIEEQFNLPDPVPVFNNEPYYVGHKNPGGEISGGNPPDDPARDSYYGRAQMYGSVLSGGLAGHVYGSCSWMGITTGEPDMGTKALRWWLPFSYESYGQMQYLGKFILLEDEAYLDLLLASEDLTPRKSEDALDTGLDGWSFMMRTPDKDLAMLYFENSCEKPLISGMVPGATYQAQWFNPRNGEWSDMSEGVMLSGKNGTLQLPSFPSGKDISQDDWALKLKMLK